MFETKRLEIIEDNYHNGHIYQSFSEYQAEKQDSKAYRTADSNYGFQIRDHIPGYLEDDAHSTRSSEENVREDCTIEKILKGDFLGRLAVLAKEFGYTEAYEREKMTENAYDCIARPANRKKPLEHNLVLSILFKLFKAID